MGATAAHRLQRDGHKVASVERVAELAREAEHGDARTIAPGQSFVRMPP